MLHLRFRVVALGLWAVVAVAPACQRAPYVARPTLAPTTAQPVGAPLTDDPTAAATIAPYRQRVTSQMATVLGTAPVSITKNPGESPLGNFVSDLQRTRASREIGQPVDMGVVTNGGLRTPLPAGSITVGSVFELMPFENELVVLDAPGSVVQELFNYAARIKMGISGATYTVRPDGTPADIRIGGQLFNPAQDRIYTIATSDYLAGGGDHLDFFKPLPPRDTGVLLRTAIAEQIQELTRQGRPIEVKTDGRVKY